MKKKMLITGTTQGIGKEIYDYYKESYDVITINRREFEGNNLICDLSIVDEVIKVTKAIKDMEIDILINNAGGSEPIVFEKMTPENLISCTNLNYHSPILLSQAVIENMIEKNIGKRRCFSVMGGFFPEDFQKWGLIWKNIGKHEKGGRRARRS